MTDTIKCKCCDNDMILRDGKFGKFYFCPNQKVCGQKTITYDDGSSKINSNELYALYLSGAGHEYQSDVISDMKMTAESLDLDWLF